MTLIGKIDFRERTKQQCQDAAFYSSHDRQGQRAKSQGQLMSGKGMRR